MAANCYRTIKIHFKRGEPDIGKKQNDIVADTCLLVAAFVCVNCSGCADRKQETEQGELVKSERLSEQFGSLSLLLRYKTLRLKEKMIR